MDTAPGLWGTNSEWDALRREWKESEWAKGRVKRAPRQWTRDEQHELFGTPVDMEGNYSAGLFTTASHTVPPSSPDTLIPNIRAWLSTEPPALPHYVETRIWMGDEPPPGPPTQPREAYHVDDYMSGPGSYTLLWFVVYGCDFDGVPSEDLVTLARELLERGANPNAVNEGDILMYACQGSHEPVLPMVELLCEYGADASVKNSQGGGHTALAHILKDHMMHQIYPRDGRAKFNKDTYECVRALLRNGAQLDACYKEASAEELLDEQEQWYPGLATNRQFLAIKGLVHGVRAAKGSYARYVKKEVLVLRALVRKRRATTDDTNQQTAFDILARSPDEISWRILGFRRW